MSTTQDNWNAVRDRLATRAAAEGLVEIAFERHDSPHGTILLGASDAGIVKIGLPAQGEDEVLESVARLVSAKVMFAPRAELTAARRQLDEYFAGKRRDFELPLDWRMSAGFRRDVQLAAARIPYGQTLSYKELAAKAGRPAAIRAAGTAMATNPLPIVVPCHRVLRTGGAIGNYGGGVEMKLRLLEHEGAIPPAPPVAHASPPRPAR